MSPLRVHLDFETRSVFDLRRGGAIRYAQDPSTEVLCAAYRIGAQPVRLWQAGEPEPLELTSAIRGGATVVAHNAMFELGVLTYLTSRPPYVWPVPRFDQIDCTMARAHRMGLPGSLDGAARALGLVTRKDKAGYALMMSMCKPRKPRLNEDPHRVYWVDGADERRRLGEYCRQDVEVECALDDVLPPLPPHERDVYHLDLKINFRGFHVDVPRMEAAAAFLAEAAQRLDARICEATSRYVTKTTQVARLKKWLELQGLEVESLAKGRLREVIELASLVEAEGVAGVLDARGSGAKVTSLSKYATGAYAAGPGDRLRGQFVYHKAITGRWAGSGYQPHNLQRIDHDRDAAEVEAVLHVLGSGASPADMVDHIELLGYEPLRALGKASRAMICASAGGPEL